MKIDYSCPQCGAPIVLNETDRLLTCPYCRVRHYLVPEDVFRYYLPPDPRLADADRVLFVPYGRFRGMYFHLLWPDIESKVIDYNFLAIKEACFPGSLGLRPQTLHLRPALFNRGEESLTPDQDLFDFQRPRTLTGSGSKSPYSRPTIEDDAYIGEVKSIVYAPFSGNSLTGSTRFRTSRFRRARRTPPTRSSAGRPPTPGKSLFFRFYVPIAAGIWRRRMKAVSCSAPNATRPGNPQERASRRSATR